MKVRVPHYYDVFACTGSRCPDTCCVGWMIEIDENAYERFMKMDGEFGERIRANIIERPDGHFFALNENGRCAFLNKDNLCEMVINLGDKALCSLCDNYPRVGVEFGGLREMGLSMSCPEVAKLMLSSKKAIRFGEWYQEDEVESTDYTRDAVFVKLMDLRDVLFGIMQNRNLSSAQRGQLYIMMASNVQSFIDNLDGGELLDAIDNLSEKFSSEEFINKAVSGVNAKTEDECAGFLKEVFEYMSGLEIINEKWNELWSRAVDYQFNEVAKKKFDKSFEEFEYVFEHLMVYYVYRYFMKMIFDGDIYSKAIMCVVSAMVISHILNSVWADKGEITLDDIIKVMYLYSKEIEHCEENMESLANEFWDNEIYEPANLIGVMAKIL